MVIIVTAMLVPSLMCFAEAEDAEKAYAYVNIYDGEKIALAMYEVAEADEDGDGAWTVNDVLITVHKEKCEGGFATDVGSYGLFITKLWGVENGGSYGYYKNNASCWSLTDAVAQGDVVYAFVYSDAATYSDAYSFFDSVTEDDDGIVTISVKYVSGYDPETYAPIVSPLEGAVITVDGVDTDAVTDADGKAVVAMTKSAVISAEKEGLVLIPPVCLFSAGFEPGDVNEDGQTDNKDVVSLFRYVSALEKEEDEAKYDFDGDGEVNNKDVVALFSAVSSK